LKKQYESTTKINNDLPRSERNIMKKLKNPISLVTSLLAVTTIGCIDRVDLRTKRSNHDRLILVRSATLDIRSGYNAVGPIDTVINYTEPERGKFEIDFIPSGIDIDEDTLDIGDLVVTKINVNKLRICGPSGTSKCTLAVIQVNTVDEDGFYNSTWDYSLPMFADTTSITTTPSTISSYTIPTGDRRLRNNDFGDLEYSITSDLGNAGTGIFESTITIKLLLGD
jgi:hypothetical protein